MPPHESSNRPFVILTSELAHKFTALTPEQVAELTRADQVKPKPPETPASFEYNETEALRLGLEKLEIRAYPLAQRLIEQVVDNSIDITAPQAQEQFVRAWFSANPDLPPPCVPNEKLWNELYPDKPYPPGIDKKAGDFWYLTQLKSRKIVQNLEGAPQSAMPQFNKDEVILVDNYTETDHNAKDAKQKHKSPLLKELLGAESTVNIKRQVLDAKLWQGDPADRIPTDKHREILEKLGVNPNEFKLRCVRQDEYARAANDQAWGQKALWTNYDHYFLRDDGDRHGLDGGSAGFGGPSKVDNDWRDRANDALAVRLVLSRN